MASIDQVISHIRFGLENLRSRNAHHEFEHLCRHLARARICSNILPATGPVALGGDQGRDFETFRTYLSSTSLANSSFIGLAASRPVAFACSIEKSPGIIRKIKSDVTTIVSGGSAVDGVHYFATADIPISVRHKLQNWAVSNHKVHLEIYDGASISELLCDRDVFWIAERYLNIPAEVFPRSSKDENNAWYVAELAKWSGKKPASTSFSEFADIRLAARQAHLRQELRQDLPFWIRLIESHFLKSPVDSIRRRSTYEVCFLNLRGLNNLEGYEDLLRQYFSDLNSLTNPTDLEAARILANYCSGALGHGVVQLSIKEVSDWQRQITAIIDRQLKETNHPNVEASLLNMKGWTFLMVDPAQPKFPDFHSAIEWWLKLAGMVENAPMFPLERFGDNITEMLEFMLELNPNARVPDAYFELTEKVDEMMAKRVGGFAAAKSCHRRASVFYDQDRTLDAIDLLHQSKIDWYASETLEQSLSVMLFLSRIYMQLGLLFAAKYYALAVAFIGINNSQLEIKSHVSFALMRAATWDYILGAFGGFLNLTEIEIPIHQAHAPNAGDLEKNEELHSIVFHLLTLNVISERIQPQFHEVISNKISSWLPKVWVDALLPSARKNLDSLTDNQLREHLASELLGTPFGDLMKTRAVHWSALGIKWEATWNNDYRTTKEAEQFLAILQIYLAEIARYDLCLMRTKAHISFELTDNTEIAIDALPSNTDRMWRVGLPRTSDHSPTDLGKAHLEVFSTVSQILHEISLLPTSDYLAVMDSMFAKGLANKIFVAHPYEAVYREFIRQKDFEQFSRDNKVNEFSQAALNSFEHKELRWKDDPGPTYNWPHAQTALLNRYERVMPSIRYTLPRLLKSRRFRGIINNLRKQGWLDWHLLAAISAVTMNERLNQQANSDQDVHKIWPTLIEEEKEWRPIPSELFSEGLLMFCLRSSMPATLEGVGLECHQLTPDFEAIDDFLRFRYNYWTDDVSHVDPFGVLRTRTAEA